MAVALAVFLIQLSLVVLALVLPRYLPDNDQTRAFREGMGSLTNSRWSGHSRLHEQQDQNDLCNSKFTKEYERERLVIYLHHKKL